MRVRMDLPRKVSDPQEVWIPLADGCRLSAKIWLPEDAGSRPVPAVLEYLPYRKSDGTSLLDAGTHAYLAGHGYAGVRVDLRGTGDSDGHLRDEYTSQEQDDAIEAIAWLAVQPWCDGAVGMMGISWGGFNSLQVAARRPPALKAVISVCSTDDRYATDEHYIGGCVMGPEMQSYATMLLGYATHAPDPAVVGDGWRDLWRRRLEGAAPALPAWLSHQRRDAYWRHGSVCEDYEAMQCAIYMVGGWADGYRDAVFRMLEHYRGPLKALVGPWCHTLPHHGTPGPAVGFLQEAVRWWDHWLKGIDTGIMDEPRLTFWMQDAYTASQDWQAKTGRWVSEEAWPSPKVAPRMFTLRPGGLQEGSTDDPGTLRIASPATTGIEGGCWISWSCANDAPGEQGPDDTRSVVFDSAPLDERLEVLGNATAFLRLVADQPQALVAVRLCDVDASGTSTLVTRGVLNLAHRDGHAAPQPLVPGAAYRVAVQLAAVAYAFPAGHRLRLALATAQWPLAWPSPRPVSLELSLADSTIELPVWSGGTQRPLPAFLTMEPEEARPPQHEQLKDAVSEIATRRDPATGRVESTWDEAGAFRVADGLVHRYEARDTWTITEGDPLSAAAESRWEFSSERRGWRARVEARSELTSDRSSFRVTCTLDAYDGDERIAGREWQAVIPRDCC